MLDNGRTEERPASLGVIDALRLPDRETSAWQRPEHPLTIILQEDGDIQAADPARLLRHQRTDQLRRHLVSPVQQRAQQPLAKSLSPVNHHPAGLPLAFPHTCAYSPGGRLDTGTP
jgi:hypothetical protein